MNVETAVRRTVLGLLLLMLLCAAPDSWAEPPEEQANLMVRLAADPADPEALIGLADLHEAAGRRRHARRYLRAFVRLVYRHPRRPEAATRLAALRPSMPWLVECDERDEGGFLVYRNAIDGLQAVRVPAGPYRRRLEVDEASVVFDVEMPDYLIDLHETPRGVLQAFLWEGGFETPAYWGREGLAWMEARGAEVPHWFTLQGGASDSNLPMWGLNYYGARAMARWAGKRIPTEAEWEKAARGGIHLDGSDGTRANPRPERRFPWGDEPVIGPNGSYRANLDCVVPARGDDGDARSVPVDSLPEGASPYGCLHMAGNVTEWNRDRWIEDEERLRLPRKAPYASETSRKEDTARSVRGGYFKEGEHDGEIDAREPRTFACAEMSWLFKAGLRSAADAPALEAEPDVGPLEDEPDPLDAERLYETAVTAEDAGDNAKAYRFARAALRLVRTGPFRERLLPLVHRLRPEDPWVQEGDGFRNLIDGKVAVRVKGLLVDRLEVTEGDLLRFAAEGGYEIGAYWGVKGRPSGHGGAVVNVARLGAGELPAVTITPAEAQAYARWARKRLPTADEWKRVAGRGERKFPWGDEKPTRRKPRCACSDSVPEVAHSLVDDRVAVGSFPDGATPEGVHDLWGSVGEWVTGTTEPDFEWPECWTLLGGGTNKDLRDLRKLPSDILCVPNVDWAYRIGFRCVSEAPPEPAATRPSK